MGQGDVLIDHIESFTRINALVTAVRGSEGNHVIND